MVRPLLSKRTGRREQAAAAGGAALSCSGIQTWPPCRESAWEATNPASWPRAPLAAVALEPPAAFRLQRILHSA
uniref:Putative secreted protein n=1 Tax=Ixodes ricinus TaxID=34613 RepID=A0A6B0TUV5_IXORI